MSALITGITIASIDQALSAVLAHVDFGAATAISAVDVTDMVLSGAPVSDSIKVQHSPDNAAWTDYGVATMGGGTRTRRFASPPGAPVSRRYWRAIIADLPNTHGRSLSIVSIRFWAETDELSPARVLPHLVSDENAYVHILSDVSSDIYSEGVRVGAAPTPYTADILRNIDFTSDDDLVLTFHEQVRPNRLFRQGADDEWDSRGQVFTNIPRFEFADTVYSNGINEQQQITFDSFSNLDTFNITFEGETTSTIVYSTTAATTCANIKAALEALDAIGGGTVTVSGAGPFTIEFTGEAGQWNWSEIAAETVTGTGAVTTATLVEGEPGGEDLVSDTRGWWRTGDFDNERLVLGGPKSAKKILNASVLGEYFNLHAPGRRATDGVMIAIAGNIRQVAGEGFLQVFTESVALSLRTPALLGDDANPIKPDGDHGVQDRMRPVTTDDATYIIQNGGRALIELRYSNEAQGYVGTNVSVRAPELVKQPVDIFARRAGFGFECNAIFLPLQAGGIVMFQSLQAQDFKPWTRYDTPASGKFLAGGTEERGAAYVVVERTIDGETVRFVEGFDINRLLDCSVEVTIGAPAATLACAHLEGEQVWAIGSNGYWYGPMEVEAGVVERPDGEDFAAGTYEVGMMFDAEAALMPIRFDSEGGSIADNPKRVAQFVVSLVNSAPPELVYMDDVYQFPGQTFPDNILDAPPMENLITGRLEIQRLRGWGDDPTRVIRRKWPGPLQVRAVAETVLWTP